MTLVSNFKQFNEGVIKKTKQIYYGFDQARVLVISPAIAGTDALINLLRFAEEKGIKGPKDLARNFNKYFS